MKFFNSSGELLVRTLGVVNDTELHLLIEAFSKDETLPESFRNAQRNNAQFSQLGVENSSRNAIELVQPRSHG